MITRRMNKTKIAPVDVQPPYPTPPTTSLIENPPLWLEYSDHGNVLNEERLSDDNQQNEQYQNRASRCPAAVSTYNSTHVKPLLRFEVQFTICSSASPDRALGKIGLIPMRLFNI